MQIVNFRLSKLHVLPKTLRNIFFLVIFIIILGAEKMLRSHNAPKLLEHQQLYKLSFRQDLGNAARLMIIVSMH